MKKNLDSLPIIEKIPVIQLKKKKDTTPASSKGAYVV